MLLQRLRSAEPTVEAAIAYNLVDLALEAPETAFADIIKVFSTINRSANPDDPRFSNNMVSISDTSALNVLTAVQSRFSLHRPDLHGNCAAGRNSMNCTSLNS